MGNFNNNRSDRSRDGDPRGPKGPMMHKAICSKCGNSCMVPFKPTGNRPIFCSDCFKTEGGGPLVRRQDERTGRPSSDRPMFDAICDKCGNRCQIPFQPRAGKQVFCSHCYEGIEKDGRGSQVRPQQNEQLDTLNAKLDKILHILATLTEKSVPTHDEPKPETISSESLPEIEDVARADEEVIKTPAKKKVVTKKKAPTKKK